MSVIETSLMEVKPWPLVIPNTGQVWKSQRPVKVAYYPALTFAYRCFFPSHLVLHFERWLTYTVVCSLWMNLFLSSVAPSSFLYYGSAMWYNKVLPRVNSTSKGLTNGFWSRLYPGRSMVPISSQFIWSQLQEEQHMAFTPLTSVKLVCVYIPVNKIRICS